LSLLGTAEPLPFKLQDRGAKRFWNYVR
jgi:hypothetical protein